MASATVSESVSETDQLERLKQGYGWNAAVNLITPMPVSWPRRTIRRLTLWGLQRAWVVSVAYDRGWVRIRPVDDQLRRFNHLHYARWSIVHRLPRLHSLRHRLPRSERPVPERGRYTLMLFTSYFDFGWRQYLGSFIETTGDGLANLWGDTPEWRYPSAGHRAFENFVVDQQVEHAHLYAAFPNVAANEIRSVLRLHHDLQAHQLTYPEGASRSAEVALLRRAQHCLGSLPALVRPGCRVPEPVVTDPAYHGLTALLPYPHDHEGRLAEVIGALPRGPDSPFALPGTHFARLALIGRRHFSARSVPPLENGYLLLSAEIDQSVEDWLALLAPVPELQPVWDLCYGPSLALPERVKRCRVRPSLEYIDYPGAAVADIHAALKGLEAFKESTRARALSSDGASGPSPVLLQQAVPAVTWLDREARSS